jgi:hypothetical protein
MGRSTSCSGDDLNAAIAKVIDADPVLQKAVADLNGAAWPELAVAPAPQPVVPITGDANWMNLGAVAKALIPDALGAAKDSLEADLEGLREGLESRDPQALSAAQEKKDAYLGKLTASGTTLRALLDDAVRGKKKGTPSIGYCANPAGLAVSRPLQRDRGHRELPIQPDCADHFCQLSRHTWRYSGSCWSF